MEKPTSAGSIRLSKSKRAVMVFMENKAYMVSVKSMKNLLEGKTPYVKLWTSEAKQGEENGEKK
ncbi:MAG: hypothetical protein QHH15_02015 [Candidatus Thermoplasmatota archaeon]|jgi:hypothetical protein|nr:hypothetical protein [Candidatus Thermoplasmatota archaeon]